MMVREKTNRRCYGRREFQTVILSCVVVCMAQNSVHRLLCAVTTLHLAKKMLRKSLSHQEEIYGNDLNRERVFRDWTRPL